MRINTKTNKQSIDVCFREIKKFPFFSFSEIEKRRESTVSILYSRGKIGHHFFSDDSGKYITPADVSMIKRGYQVRINRKSMDGIRQKYSRPKRIDVRQLKLKVEADIKARIDEVARMVNNLPETLSLDVAQEKVWKASMISAVLVGMVSMSFIYKYLGPDASAQNKLSVERLSDTDPVVLGEEKAKDDNDDVLIANFIASMDEELTEKAEFEKQAREMVSGYPIEKMLPEILKKDRLVATFLISIAKKESNWGKRVPVLNGQDCYNYWGYRGIRKLMGTGGHTCFNNRRDAVDTVAKRLETLINKEKLDTPKKLIVWKCGFSCEGHSDYSVNKWISDVELYHKKLID